MKLYQSPFLVASFLSLTPPKFLNCLSSPPLLYTSPVKRLPALSPPVPWYTRTAFVVIPFQRPPSTKPPRFDRPILPQLHHQSLIRLSLSFRSSFALLFPVQADIDFGHTGYDSPRAMSFPSGFFGFPLHPPTRWFPIPFFFFIISNFIPFFAQPSSVDYVYSISSKSLNHTSPRVFPFFSFFVREDFPAFSDTNGPQ